MRDRVHHVPADGEVEGAIGQPELVDAAVLEGQSRGQRRVARPRQLQMMVEDVHAEHGRAREQLGKP